MNIAFCYTNFHSQLLYIPLMRFLEKQGHKTLFLDPDVTGGYFLFKNKIHCETYSSTKEELIIPDLEKKMMYVFALIDQEVSNSKQRRIKKFRMYKRAVRLAGWYRLKFTTHNIDLVYVWNGLRLHTVVASAVARELNIPCIYLEKGLLPRTLQVDITGVNANHSMRYKFVDAQNIVDSNYIYSVQEQLIKPWRIPQPLKSVPTYKKIMFLLYEGLWSELWKKAIGVLINLRKRKGTELTLTEPIKENGNDKLPQKYIFLPLQVSTDAQILCFSPWIKTMEQLIRVVATCVQRVDPMLTVVVKPHPAELETFRRSYPKQLENVRYSSEGTVKLIQHSIMTITINSTVGFEATAFLKPVILLGNALYSTSPIFEIAHDESQLEYAIKKSISKVGQEQETAGFLKTCSDLMVECDYINPSVDDLKRFWNYSLNILS
jgi:hypothetical protein